MNEWFEFARQRTKSASGIIGTFLGSPLAGTAYVRTYHYMGEIDGAFRAWGFAKNGNGGVTAAIANSARALGVDIDQSAPVSQVIVKGDAPRVSCWENGDERARGSAVGGGRERSFLQFR